MIHEQIDTGFLLRTMNSQEDIVNIADFHRTYNNTVEGDTCECLLQHHPSMGKEDFFLIEDQESNNIIATICLIPWEISYEGVCLNAVMLEMVLTHPNHRHHGLIRELMKKCADVIRQRKYDFSIITGIPYYYRQYGYGYGIDLAVSETLETKKIPLGADQLEIPCSFRAAELSDISVLKHLYDDVMKGIDLYVCRDELYWRYLIKHAKQRIYIIDNQRTRSVAGYLVVDLEFESKHCTVMESAILDYQLALSVLQNLKKEHIQQIVIHTGRNDMLEQMVKSLGSITEKGDQYLLQIHSPSMFLKSLLPALEKRLQKSGCGNVTTNIIINFYRNAIQLRIESGRITVIEDLGFVDSSMGADGGDLCIPMDAFIRLLFGYRDLEQLKDAWPDIHVKRQSRYIIEALFPTMKSYLYMPYHYKG